MDLLHVAGLEADRGPARQVQAHAVRLGAIEDQPAVDFEEVVVRANLYRPVARVVHRDRHHGPIRIELEVVTVEEELTRKHARSPKKMAELELSVAIVSELARES